MRGGKWGANGIKAIGREKGANKLAEALSPSAKRIQSHRMGYSLAWPSKKNRTAFVSLPVLILQHEDLLSPKTRAGREGRIMIC